MREKTNKQANQVESFWREIGNWLDLSASYWNKYKTTMLEWRREP